MKVIKKDGTLEEFDGQKIVNAVSKSAARVMVTITDSDFHDLVSAVIRIIHHKGLEEIPVSEMHNIMEQVLENFNPAVAKSYKDYRNYKRFFVHMMDEVFMQSQSIRFIGDKEKCKYGLRTGGNQTLPDFQRTQQAPVQKVLYDP